jgi:hypothetical protein
VGVLASEAPVLIPVLVQTGSVSAAILALITVQVEVFCALFTKMGSRVLLAVSDRPLGVGLAHALFQKEPILADSAVVRQFPRCSAFLHLHAVLIIIGFASGYPGLGVVHIFPKTRRIVLHEISVDIIKHVRVGVLMESLFTAFANLEGVTLALLQRSETYTCVGFNIEIVVVNALLAKVVAEVSSTVFNDHRTSVTFVSFEEVVLVAVLACSD